MNSIHRSEVLDRGAALLLGALSDHGIKARIAGVAPGPVVTTFAVELQRGGRIAAVMARAADIGLSMGVDSARIMPIPGSGLLGIELPNSARHTVQMRPLIDAGEYRRSPAKLPLILGRSTIGRPMIADLAAMPHLLIAGTTGSGKSVGIHGMIISLLYRLPASRLRFIMIDPKMVELSAYDGIPHLLTPVIVDPAKAITALKWAVVEMRRRLALMHKEGVQNIGMYNQKVVSSGDTEPLPYIVVVLDELAELMEGAPAAVETCIQRMSQVARAAGIHLIIATQRPDADVITKVIKANMPARLSYQVPAFGDSRTILGCDGAEKLLGAGDFLIKLPADALKSPLPYSGQVVRGHAPLVLRSVERVASQARMMGVPQYLEEIFADQEIADAETVGGTPARDSELSRGGGGNRPKMSLPEWLRESLAVEPQKVADLLQEGWDIGRWPERTIYDAKKTLGIKHFRQDNAAYWYLPGVTPDSRLATRGGYSAVPQDLEVENSIASRESRG